MGAKHNMNAEFKIEAVKTLPAAGGAAWYALSLNEVVAAATLFYIVLQCAYLIWKWRKESKQ